MKTMTLQESVKKIDLKIKSLEKEKIRLYDKEVKKNFSRGDLVIYEDGDPSTKFVFDYVKNGKVYGRSLKSGEQMAFASSMTLIHVWKKIDN
jgi:hypothetical protein